MVMVTIEDHILSKAREFDNIGDWPQPFGAFIPPGGSEARTEKAIRDMQKRGQLAVLGFEAEGMPRVDVVAGFGPRIPHHNGPGPGEPAQSHRAQVL
ncbi:hypothetical protein GCM10022223_67450 [Kineosporia mesophila]|uniref:Uncharacterized protein n=2 Tax=Kineosporia mesophila TaxID=566012 RepID=A0ABP7ARG6_9ACTN